MELHKDINIHVHQNWLPGIALACRGRVRGAIARERLAQVVYTAVSQPKQSRQQLPITRYTCLSRSGA